LKLHFLFIIAITALPLCGTEINSGLEQNVPYLTAATAHISSDRKTPPGTEPEMQIRTAPKTGQQIIRLVGNKRVD